MSSPVVSVIMLVYNQENTFARALESVLSQKCAFSYEILIGDDCSTDKTREIIKGYLEKHPNIRYFEREENLGVTRNAYELLKAAEGKYIASCEGDDFWTDENKLQKQVDFLEAHPEYVGCSHDLYLVTENGDVYSKSNPSWISRKRSYSYKDFKGLYLPGQSGTIVKRNVFKDRDCRILYEASSTIGDRTTVLLCFPYGKFYRFKDRMSAYTLPFDDKATTVTFNAFKKNAHANRSEWEYTERLEKFVNENFNEKVSFEHYKHGLFFSALAANILKSDKADEDLPAEILKNAKFKIVYIFAIFYWFVLKLFRKCSRRSLKKRYDRVKSKK